MLDPRAACCLLVLSLLLTSQGVAQTLPTIFLDCDACDGNYLRRELNFVNHVRDQADAEIYVLVTSQQTAAGGRSYVLNFEGRERFEGIDQTLRHTASQAETDDQRREGLAQVIRMGALPYLSQTPIAGQFHIDFEPGTTAVEIEPVTDPWNHWVIRIDAGGAVEAEESQNEIGFEGGARLSRITEAWKTIIDFDMEIQQDRFESDEETIVSTSREFDSDYTAVKSLNERWSAGLIGEIGSTTFSNLKLQASLAPAIEYNLYPWLESDRRVLAIAYFAGVQHYAYFEETLFGRASETLGFHSLRIQADFVQPWGEIFAQVEANQFLHDLTKNSIEIEAVADLRITRGLSLFVGVQTEIIHDQLFLSAGGATLEEVLLRRRQLATNFSFSVDAGLRFTFGSIYNNVVNQRL